MTSSWPLHIQAAVAIVVVSARPQMSLSATMRPLSPSSQSLSRSSTRVPPKLSQDIPFHQQPSYITLTRTLTRLSNVLLPLSSSLASTPDSDSSSNPNIGPDPSSSSPESLSVLQQNTLTALLSPLPYHRTKYIRTIEHARSLLLGLEQTAQGIKVQRAKRDAVKDLAEKRKVLRRLRSVVEDLGREAETRARGEQGKGRIKTGDFGGVVDGNARDQGETVEELLGLPRRAEDEPGWTPNGTEQDREPTAGQKQQSKSQQPSPEDIAESPSARTAPDPSSISHPNPHFPSPSPTSDPRSDLLNLRKRRGQPTSPSAPDATTTSTSTSTSKPFTPPPPLTATQETLTSSLLTLSRQLKAQSQALSTTLMTSDRDHLSSAMGGLDRSAGLLEVAGRQMGALRRMSEGEGLWGRLMLYLWILGLWVAVLGLVGVGPKLRF